MSQLVYSYLPVWKPRLVSFASRKGGSDSHLSVRCYRSLGAEIRYDNALPTPPSTTPRSLLQFTVNHKIMILMRDPLLAFIRFLFPTGFGALPSDTARQRNPASGPRPTYASRFLLLGMRHQPPITSHQPPFFMQAIRWPSDAKLPHPLVLPSCTAHQNMGTPHGSDCDPGQRHPGWACWSPM